MKGILKFNLDDRFDKLAHIRALKAADAYLCLLALRSHLLECAQRGDGNVHTWDQLCEFFDNTLERHDVNLDRELE